ncbi:28 kDa heat- and acid-stable phosphoprotein [Scaptodrosophila lebanonensis]|uniref:28 kDa heat- and acid-stable phosphoprotein n=1 Tax=Drosophila lebanonensis TaxID=7225 RepID=A0A6J2TN17_DROLE|nr:28 kDa heat- and acid-stable phosphoprotein [Scaptodrosophila lebanonensis]XP_030378001.1 28 kDa heat- and acid-stable phosphoprotein [Scaptodrosophila lebanonensis]
MPRGKYVNHKGRSRHFTSPEELQQESEEESEQSSSGSENESGEEKAAGGASSSAKPKQQQSARKPARPAQKSRNAAGSSSEEDSEEDSEDDSEAEARGAKKGVASLIEIENPNRVTKKATQKISQLKIDENAPTTSTKPELSRREREQIEKQKARQRYEKLHAAGKTTEAKADLARLALIRQQRQEAAAKREAEKKAAADAKKPAAK